MDELEDLIAAIIEESYATTGFVDEGRADGAAREIMTLLKSSSMFVLPE